MSKRSPGLLEDLALVGDEQESRLATSLGAKPPVVKGRNNCFAGSSRGDQQVAISPMRSFMLQTIEHHLLETLRLKVEPGPQRNHLTGWTSSLNF
jgi:hypothetical protein